MTSRDSDRVPSTFLSPATRWFALAAIVLAVLLAATGCIIIREAPEGPDVGASGADTGTADAGTADAGADAGDGGGMIGKPSPTELSPGGAFRAPESGVTLSAGPEALAETVSVQAERVEPPAEPLPSLYRRVVEPVRVAASGNVGGNPERPLLLGIPIPSGVDLEKLALAVRRPGEHFSKGSRQGYEWDILRGYVDPDSGMFYAPIPRLWEAGLVYTIVESPYHEATPLKEVLVEESEDGDESTRRQKLELISEVRVVCEAFDLQSSVAPATTPCSQALRDRISSLTLELMLETRDLGYRPPNIERDVDIGYVNGVPSVLEVKETVTVYAQKYHDETVDEQESVSDARAGELAEYSDGVPMAECESTCSSSTFDDEDLEGCTVDTANDRVTCSYTQKIGGCTSGGGLNGRMSWGGKMTVCIRQDECDRRFRCEAGSSRCEPCDDPSTGCSYSRSCSEDADCAVGYRCASGSCTSACSSDADCEPGYACDSGSGRCQGWCGLSQTRSGTVRHELMHAIQTGYTTKMPVWLMESTAEVSSHTEDTMLPDIARGFRKVGYPLALFDNSKPNGTAARWRFAPHGAAAYRAQDFWEYVGLTRNRGLALFEAIYAKMLAEKPGSWGNAYPLIDEALDTSLGMSTSLGDLYWAWVKNQVVEHKVEGWRRPLGQACSFREKRVLEQGIQAVDYTQGADLDVRLPDDGHWWRTCWDNPNDDSSSAKCWDQAKNSDDEYVEADGWSCSGGYCKPASSCSSAGDCDEDFTCSGGACVRETGERKLEPLTSTALKLTLKGGARDYNALVFVRNPDQSTPQLKRKVYEADEAGTNGCQTRGDLTDPAHEVTVPAGQDKTVYVLVSNTSLDTSYPVEVSVVTRREIDITKPTTGLTYKSSDEPTGIFSDSVEFVAETRGFEQPDSQVEISWGYQAGASGALYAMGKTGPGESLVYDELPCAETLIIKAIAFDGPNFRSEDSIELKCTYGALVVRATRDLTGNVRKDGFAEGMPTGTNTGELIVGDRMVGGRERVYEALISFDLADLPQGVSDVMYGELFLWEDERNPRTNRPALGSLRIWPVTYGSSLEGADFGAAPLGMNKSGFSYGSVALSDLRQDQHLERVSDSARYFVEQGLSRAQFRLAFSRETDSDGQDDYVAFHASRINTLLWPYLRIEYQMSTDPCCGRVDDASMLPGVCANTSAAQCTCNNDPTGFCCNPSDPNAFSNPVWTRSCVEIYQQTCQADTGCHVNECTDGIDNDGDGWTDYPQDPQCNNQADPSESNLGGGFLQKTDCADGKDNDGDGKIDAADSGCRNGADDDETG